MKRILIKKLIVISNSNQISREINFKKGLNIIIGDNKTGKSSIIKSIFYALGCELKMEEDWKKLIDTYLLFFNYGEFEYCIIRKGKNFIISSIEENGDNTKVLINTNNFDEYNKELMNILNISMICTNIKTGQAISATAPLLFRFQYIDQDNGWGKIGESFKNLGYINDWRKNSIHYVFGYQGEEFYKTKHEIITAKIGIDNLKLKMHHYNELIETIKDAVKGNEKDERAFINLKPDIYQTKLLIEELTEIEKKRIELEDNLSILKNERYEKYLGTEAIKKHVNFLNKDHEFAKCEDDIIKCPFCGAEHKNGLEERTEIIKDIQSGNQLLKVYRADIKLLDNQINLIDKEKNDINKRYLLLKKKLENLKEGASIVETYKNLGKNEVIQVSVDENMKIEKDLKIEEDKKFNLDKTILELKSTKRRKKIYDEFKTMYTVVLEKANIPLSYMKINDFLQSLNKTGSDLPRIILSYQIAQFLFSISKGENLFNWIVIDTPNQQGQDGKNLRNIDSLLDLLLDTNGQAIIGTERKTGYESKANNLIQLTEHKKCLSNARYKEHVKLYEQLTTTQE